MKPIEIIELGQISIIPYWQLATDHPLRSVVDVATMAVVANRVPQFLREPDWWQMRKLIEVEDEVS